MAGGDPGAPCGACERVIGAADGGGAVAGDCAAPIEAAPGMPDIPDAGVGSRNGEPCDMPDTLHIRRADAPRVAGIDRPVAAASV